VGASGRKGGKVKPLPGALQTVLDRMNAEGDEARYPSATALLEDLDRISAEVPANSTAWERFVRQVREQSVATAVRQSA
jgi:hypothetical protein